MLIRYETVHKFEIYYRAMTSILFVLLRTNCSQIPQILISPVELHLSSTFPLFLNLFVTFPYGSLLLIGQDRTEMGFGRKEF